MTYGECKKCALALADSLDTEAAPYTFEADTSAKLPVFITLGLRLIAKTANIIKTATLTSTEAQKLDLPEDCCAVTDISGSGQARISPDKKLEVSCAGSWEICYSALPQELTSSTPDTALLDIAPAAEDALPYFVAAQLLLSDEDPAWASLQSRFDAAMSSLYSGARPVGFYRV